MERAHATSSTSFTVIEGTTAFLSLRRVPLQPRNRRDQTRGTASTFFRSRRLQCGAPGATGPASAESVALMLMDMSRGDLTDTARREPTVAFLTG